MFDETVYLLSRFNFGHKYTPFLIGGLSAFVFGNGVVTGVGMVLLWQMVQ